MRDFSLPPLAEPLRTGGLADSVYETAAADPKLPAHALRRRSDGEWYEVSAAGFRTHVLGLARGLLADGIRFGERVAVMTGTRYECALFTYALWSIGCHLVPLYPNSSPELLRWILTDSGAGAVVVENENDAMSVGSVCGDVAGLRRIWQLDSGCVRQLTLSGREVPDAYVHDHRRHVTPRSTAAVVYSSGTTGRPRGCVLTHSNLAAQADTVAAGWGHLMGEDGEQPSLLGFLPVGHIYGLVATVLCQRAGMLLGHEPGLEEREVLPAIAAFEPSCVFAVPHVYEQVYARARSAALDEGRVEQFDQAMEVAARYAEALENREAGVGPGPGPALRARHARHERTVYRRVRAQLGGRARSVVAGGSALSRELDLMLRGAGITVYASYGLTETAGAICAQPPEAPRAGTVGRPLPGSAVHVAEDGEVWVRGGTVFAGYEGDAFATRAVLHQRWLATGDLGRLDEDGYLTLTGRKKDTVTTSAGESIAPLPLEARLRAHPLVAEALVVGENRPFPAALITLDPQVMEVWQRSLEKGREEGRPFGGRGDDLAEELQREIGRAVAAVNATVPRSQAVRAFRILADEFTVANGLLTPSLKLRREVIARAYASQIAELYARG